MPRDNICEHCCGTGRADYYKNVGLELRAYRERCGFTASQVGKAMRPPLGKSAVSLLESGDRRATPKKQAAYRKAVEKLRKI